MAKGRKGSMLGLRLHVERSALNNLFINSISYDYPVRNELFWALIKTERDNTIYL